MPALLLQKPSSWSKAKEHALHLEHCLKAWSEGKLDDLMRECCTIQQLNRSQHSQQNSCDRTAKLFAKLMMEAKVRAVLRLVTQANGSGPLPLNNLANPDNPTNTQTVRDILLKNIHPNSHLKKSTIITSDTPSAESTPYCSMKWIGNGFATPFWEWMVQQVNLALMQPHGNVFALLLSLHLPTYVNLWQPLPDGFVLVMWIPVECLPLLLAGSLLWTNALALSTRILWIVR